MACTSDYVPAKGINGTVSGNLCAIVSLLATFCGGSLRERLRYVISCAMGIMIFSGNYHFASVACRLLLLSQAVLLSRRTPLPFLRMGLNRWW